LYDFLPSLGARRRRGFSPAASARHPKFGFPLTGTSFPGVSGAISARFYIPGQAVKLTREHNFEQLSEHRNFASLALGPPFPPYFRVQIESLEIEAVGHPFAR